MKKITEYNFPEDLKKMSEDELNLLSYEIRDFLLNKVSRTGGHLASNLGVVELTIALHKVFNSPTDKIIWDVGHQAYVHKILTGRADRFDTLRQYGGLSGFPRCAESEHDFFDTGHSTTSISQALGMAAARDLKGEDYNVVAVIGDGSLTGGMAFEAMNNAGASKVKMIVVLNDNGMSISQNIGGLSKYLLSLRTSKSYLSAKNFIKNRIKPIPNVGENIADGLANFKNDIKYTIMGSGEILFEELGFTYLGPVDGHNITELNAVLTKAGKLNEPVLVHVITKKGKGYKNAENNPSKFHGIGPFDPETGQELKKSKAPSYSSIMGSHLVEMAKSNPDIVAVTAAMGDATGLGDFRKYDSKRFFDVGIAEAHAVTFAAGLAKSGMKPFVCIYSSFLQRAYDQILEDVCLNNLPVVFCIDRAGNVGADGETHNGVFDLSYLSSCPNMTVFTPCTAEDLTEAMDKALEINGPVAIRYPRGEASSRSDFSSYNDPVDPENNDSDVQILACGRMLEKAEKAAEIAEKRGKKVIVTPVNRIVPFDNGLIDASAKRIITLEDNVLSGGFGEHLDALLKNDPGKEIINLGWPNRFIEQGSFDELAKAYDLDEESIAKQI